jgi:amino acid transporter/predicted flap endonuclease-1-like 5' DNA nuclease
MADNKHLSEDKKILHSMGYAQELSRSMSKFSNFAISFSIICILSGGINSFAQATSSIGGAGAGIAWLVGCLISGFFALSMAQIASAFPTAGGLYHWSSILGNRFWGYLTAWLNLLGLITVLGAINIGTAFFFAGTFGPAFGFDGSTPGQIVGFVALITILQALLNHFGIKLTTMLTDISGYIILATTAVLVLAMLFGAQSIDLSRLWTFTNYSGEAGGNVFPQSDSMFYLFLLSLLLPVYTITGYDASAHTSEETVNAATSVPQGIITSVVWSSLAGWIMLCAIVLAIPDLAAGAKQGWAVFFETMNAVVPNWLKQLLYLGIFVTQFLCGLATVTSASRMLFAFSRDGGMPIGSEALSTVSREWRTPVNAIWTAAILCIIYVFLAQFISIGGTNIYTIVVNSTLIFLFLSFIIPLMLGMFAYGTSKWQKFGPWAMSEGTYKLVTWLALIGMGIIFYIAIQPPNDKVLWIVLGFIALAVVLWFAGESSRFKGPPIGDEIKRRQAEIAAREKVFGESDGTVHAAQSVMDAAGSVGTSAGSAAVGAAAAVAATAATVAARSGQGSGQGSGQASSSQAEAEAAARRRVAAQREADEASRRAAAQREADEASRRAAAQRETAAREAREAESRRAAEAQRSAATLSDASVDADERKATRKVAPKRAAAPAKKVATKKAAPARKVARTVLDDITLVDGIGPKLKKDLASAGIRSLADLSKLSASQITALDAKIPRDADQIADWVSQAKDLLAGKAPRAASDRARSKS